MPELNEQKKIADSTAVLAECEELEGEIAGLRAAYEQYFLGMERRPPTDRHDALKKRLLKLKSTWTRQTAAKFRVQSVATKFATYERLWARTLQEIENGTYIRDLKRARRKQEKQEQEQNAKSRAPRDDFQIDEVPIEQIGESLEDAMANAIAAVSAPRPAAPAVAPAAAPVVTPAVATVAPLVPPIAPAVPSAARPMAASASSAPGGLPRITPVAPSVPPVSAPPASVSAAAGARPPPSGIPASKPAGPSVPPHAAVAKPPAAPPVSAVTRPVSATTPAPRPAVATGAPPAAPRPASTPPAPAAVNANLSDEKLRAVYDAYVKAKKRCNEDTSGLSYEQVAASLRKQVPELMKQHNARAVEFKVVIKDGKAVLRAVPKEG